MHATALHCPQLYKSSSLMLLILAALHCGQHLQETAAAAAATHASSQHNGRAAGFGTYATDWLHSSCLLHKHACK
jgi:hypothetical protein